MTSMQGDRLSGLVKSCCAICSKTGRWRLSMRCSSGSEVLTNVHCRSTSVRVSVAVITHADSYSAPPIECGHVNHGAGIVRDHATQGACHNCWARTLEQQTPMHRRQHVEKQILLSPTCYATQIMWPSAIPCIPQLIRMQSSSSSKEVCVV